MRIVLTGGGTGGHIFPIVAIARKLREKLGVEAELLYIGSGAKMEREVMVQEKIPVKFVNSGKLRRYFALQNFVDIFKIPVGFIQSLWQLLVFMPDVVFSKGGYVSIPVVLAAWIYRIPVFIHESDAVPGMTNQILEKFARAIVVAYPHAQQFFPAQKTALYGNPVRDNLLGGDPTKGREFFNLTESKKTILVLGGSQGAQSVNRAIVKILPELLNYYQVIHQTGERDLEATVRLAGEYGIKAGHGGYLPLSFLSSEDLKQGLAVADLIISRAGANSIAEIAAYKKPAILIPLENAANDHQRMNAYEIAKIGGALVLEETNLGQNILMEKIKNILENEERKKEMGEKISAFYHPQAVDNIIEGIITLGRA